MELRARGWSPVAVLDADVYGAEEFVRRYELAGVPLLVPLDAFSREVYAPSWAHELLRVFDREGLYVTLTQQAVAAVLDVEDGDALASALCSAALLGGAEAVGALASSRRPSR